MKTKELIFWGLDLFQGGKIRKDYKNIESIITKKNTSTCNLALERILHHSIQTVPYYKGFALSTPIDNFPVVNKNIIKNNWNNFLSSSYDKLKLKLVTTSGSTGTPFQVYNDNRKISRNYADTLFFSKQAGYSLGNTFFYMKIWVKSRMSSPLIYKLQNIYPIDVLNFSHQEIELILKKIKKYNCSILAYASVLDIISKYLIDNKIKIENKRLKSVIAMSETLSEETKNNLSERFGICVVSRYSNLECGIMAQQPADYQCHYLINKASYFIEILKMDSDEPTAINELGRIVVTDLYNYAQPMIRYDTGDIGAFEDIDKNYFKIIEGRKLDLLYNTKGELISSFIVYKNMWQYPEIDQYQLAQEDEKVYKIKIASKNKFVRQAKLIEEFNHYLGQDAVIKIELVESIPLLASGKRKKVVNNYKK